MTRRQIVAIALWIAWSGYLCGWYTAEVWRQYGHVAGIFNAGLSLVMVLLPASIIRDVLKPKEPVK